MKKLAPFFVAIGAISYGIPASLFKLAGRDGVANGPLLFWSFLISAVVLTAIHLVRGPRLSAQATSWRQILLVTAAGTASGLTNTFYITALRSIPVAVAAVMLMQSVWLSVLLGAVIHHRWPSRLQVISIVLVLGGTVLAAGLLPLTGSLSLAGVLLSFLAAVAYAATLQATANLGNNLDPLSKTWLMAVGAFILIAIVWGPQLLQVPLTGTAVGWGALVAVFSMILPLACYSIFMPRLLPGVGPVLSSLELPASIAVAFLLLGEQVSISQLLGVLVIIGAVTLSNVGSRLWHH
ncbi:transport protein [Levilactobacillus paucivorans]|uniref:Transport protein n=1 Tax=Levilactobacillus paucivorans TaxID=616990 RepID=A0A0R2LRP1_9LACO|nr:DMT family transporter [Levilactobacillus paucivorans]KRO04089.1 transport protein [Levilactobacillus paucivorans]